MSSSRKLLLVGLLALLILGGSWGVVFASAGKMLQLSPGRGALIPDTRPLISANWSLPGIRFSGATVTLDGEDVTDQVTVGPQGFTLRPAGELVQGPHVIKADMKYRLVVGRRISATWRFVVDTEPPALKLTGNANFVVSSGPAVKVEAESEPGAAVAAALNQKPVARLVANRSGRLSVSLSNLERRSQLRLSAQDKAGNVRSVLLPVIRDESTPTIKALIPADGEVVRHQSPKIAATFTEEDSGLRNIRLLIDGTEAVSKSDGSLDLTYLGDLLADGAHKATIEAEDYAGHKITHDWRFNIDSRRILVSRSERRLYFFRNGGLERVYPVAIGTPNFPTPVGKWKIVNKQINPSWYNPGSDWAKEMPKVIPGGPGNPLGTRAMALNSPGVLIHGTYSVNSVGTAASHGCIRMRISDIEAFFPIVSVGVPVDVIN